MTDPFVICLHAELAHFRRHNPAKVYKDHYEKPIVTIDGDDAVRRPSANLRAAYKVVLNKPISKRSRRSRSTPRLQDASLLALE